MVHHRGNILVRCFFSSLPVPTPSAAIGPRFLSNALLFARIFSGTLGGFAGTLVILAIIFMVNLLGTEDIGAFSLFAAVVMAVLGSIVPNLVSLVLFSLFDRERYRDTGKILVQTFVFHIVFVTFALPLFFVANSAGGAEYVNMALVTVLATSAFMSFIVAEALSNPKYLLVPSYGAAMALLVSLFIHLLLLSRLDEAGYRTLSLLLTMPVTWGCIGLFSTVAEMIYGAFYRLYGVDVLSSSSELYLDGNEDDR